MNRTEVSKQREVLRDLDMTENPITRIRDMVLAGEIPPLEALSFFRKMTKILKDADDMIIGAAEDEVLKYSAAEQKAGVKVNDAEFAVRMTGTKFKPVDPLIIEAKARLKTLEDLGKDAAKGKIAVDKETGQMIEASEIQTGQMKVFVTLKK